MLYSYRKTHCLARLQLELLDIHRIMQSIVKLPPANSRGAAIVPAEKINSLLGKGFGPSEGCAIFGPLPPRGDLALQAVQDFRRPLSQAGESDYEKIAFDSARRAVREYLARESHGSGQRGGCFAAALSVRAKAGASAPIPQRGSSGLDQKRSGRSR